jgi:matrixin
VRAAGPAGSAGPAAQGAATSPCDEGGCLKSGEIWPNHRYGWRWRASTFGANSDTLRAVELGAQAWDLTKDNCDFGDITTITPVYDGVTDALAGAQDNVDTVDRGSMASFGCEGALACTRVWYSPAGTVEADIRFSDRVKWSTSGTSGAYDYRSVATHEFGHFIGLSDLHDSPGLTMYYATDMASTGPRTLGRGDVLGLRALYP